MFVHIRIKNKMYIDTVLLQSDPEKVCMCVLGGLRGCACRCVQAAMYTYICIYNKKGEAQVNLATHKPLFALTWIVVLTSFPLFLLSLPPPSPWCHFEVDTGAVLALHPRK